MSPRSRRTAQRKRQWEKWRGFGIGVVAVVCGAALIWALFGPAAEWLARHDIGAAKGSVLESALQNARSAYLTLAAGILAAGALVYTARNHRLSREGHVTDRYTRAIEQLGSDSIHIRIGGIFALERVARDSARDHSTVMEVLSAFLRERSAQACFEPERPTPAMPQDVRAAITVIGRRDDSRDAYLAGQGLDLVQASLVLADLHNAALANANLMGAVLCSADLGGADLSGSDMGCVDLSSAYLAAANLSGADLYDANLSYACLRQANLRHANMTSVDVTGADLSDTDLSHAIWSDDAIAPAGWRRGPDGRLQRVSPQARPQDDASSVSPSKA